MKINDETKIAEYNIVFKKINEIRGLNYVALQGVFVVYDNKKNIVTKLKPENRFYLIENNFTTEISSGTISVNTDSDSHPRSVWDNKSNFQRSNGGWVN